MQDLKYHVSRIHFFFSWGLDSSAGMAIRSYLGLRSGFVSNAAVVFKCTLN